MSKLLVKPKNENTYQDIIPSKAKWQHLTFKAQSLKEDETFESNTGDSEILIVLLGGNFSVSSNVGDFKTINGRKDVFSGYPHALYLPRGTSYTLTANSPTLDIALGMAPVEKTYPPHFVTPDTIQERGIEIRGGDNATRQINPILPPGSECEKLVCVEVYTPSGNWSSFPAHKHDTRKVSPEGKITEAALEETYFYKIDKPNGFAIQRVYTDDRELDEVMVAENNDVVLVPKGYHPVVAGHGYNVYYLNFLAGSDQSLANSDDPHHKWVYDSWKSKDPRIPLTTKDGARKHEV
ncbi:5-deoxy-glucuronate isomerase [Bacteriovoracaceae bacterium]|nr:5-deoxy-glucuronate isomerase [Bacteriovoracaceae bacterium]